jgi:hypothetical protein
LDVSREAAKWVKFPKKKYSDSVAGSTLEETRRNDLDLLSAWEFLAETEAKQAG